MPARPIHRFGSVEKIFRGAKPSSLPEIQGGDAALFSLDDHIAEAQAIRDASWFAPSTPSAPGVHDLGNAVAECDLVCAAIRRHSGRPFLLGGTIEHAAALALRSEATTVALLSARLDLPVAIFTQRNLIAVGSHDLLPASSVRAWREAGGVIVPATSAAPLEDRLQTILQSRRADRRAVVILDASVVDTGYAAGAHSLNVGGLTPLELLAAMKAVTDCFEIEGMAVVNLRPHRDSRGHSELLAAEAVDLAVGSIAARVPA